MFYNPLKDGGHSFHLIDRTDRLCFDGVERIKALGLYNFHLNVVMMIELHWRDFSRDFYGFSFIIGHIIEDFVFQEL